MMQHGYVRDLRLHAEELGYTVVQYEKLGFSFNKLNPTGVMVIKKDVKTSENELCDPISKKQMIEYDDCYFCENSMLSYPKIGKIPCLTRQNAVLTTKYGSQSCRYQRSRKSEE